MRLVLLKLLLLLMTATAALGALHPRVEEARTSVDLATLKRHVAQIAAEPHPVGSAANRRVRAYLLAELAALGFSPRVVRHEVETFAGPVTVQNVLCPVPPTGGAPAADPGAVYVVTHYDSAPRAPGAGDAAASVAALLETARLLAQSPPPGAPPVVLLLTDGEEAGLLGARAWAMDRGAYPACAGVLNFDGRGSAGPSLMFETSRLSRAWLGAYAAGAEQPVTSSLADEVYRRMPNATDFTVFARAGVPGLNFAFIDGFHRYHTPGDRPEHLSDATLLHHAHQMHGVLRQVLAMPAIPAEAAEAGERERERAAVVFFDVLAMGVVRYGVGWAIGLGIAGLLLPALACWRYRPAPAGVARAAGVYLLALLGLAGWAQLAAMGLGWLGGIAEPGTAKALNAWLWPLFLAVAAAALGVMLGVRRFMRGVKPTDRGMAIALLFGVGSLGSAIALPGGSYLFAWPALLLGMAVLLPEGRWRAAGLLGAATGATLILLPIAWLVSVALGLGMMAAGAGLLGLLGWTWAVALEGDEPARV